MPHPLRIALRYFLLLRPTALPRSADRRRSVRSRQICRRPTQIQARALEALAHALEYLEDNALATNAPFTKDVKEAIKLLVDRSRAVFAECRQVVPWHQRLSMQFDHDPAAVGITGPPFQKAVALVHSPQRSR